MCRFPLGWQDKEINSRWGISICRFSHFIYAWADVLPERAKYL